MRLLQSLLVLSTLSGGINAQWTEQTSGVSIPLTSVCAVMGSGPCGWICGYNGTVLRTTNAGTNWVSVGINGIPLTCQLQNITAFDGGTALTTGNIGTTTYVFRTTNGGSNWSQVFTQANGQINAIWMSLNFFGKCFMEGNPVGGRWSLWRTSNSGANWDSTGLYLPQSGSETGWTNSLTANSSYFWFGTTNSRIYFSSDTGHSWSVQQTSPLTNVQSIWMGSLGIGGLAYGQDFIKTTNNGSNWVSTGSAGSGFYGGLTGVQFLPLQWLARGNTIYMTTNLGGNWIIQSTAPSGNYRSISFISSNPSYVWAVRDNGGISMMYFSWGGIKRISGNIPESFSLFQNYPNPFNPSTRIKFQAPPTLPEGEAIIKLVIYDILGNEIATLVNEQLKPGSYEVEWDGSNYPSGVYFYKLITESFSETRKMVLIK